MPEKTKIKDTCLRTAPAGADRILTSGGAQTAIQGMKRIAGLVAKANRRISVMVGGTVRLENIGELARKTNASEFHASLRKPRRNPVSYHNHMLPFGGSSLESGLDDFTLYSVSADDVRALRDALETSARAGRLHG